MWGPSILGQSDVAISGVRRRARAAKLVFEHQGEFDSQWAAISSILAKLGTTKETLRRWVREAEVDGGQRPELSYEERSRIRELERENRELRREPW